MSENQQKREEILDEDRLLRRILDSPPEFIIKPDGTPSSSNFSLRSGEEGLSVDIERLTTHEVAIQDPKRFRLYSLLAEDTIELDLENVHAPLEDNYAHALIKGNITRSVARKLAKKAQPVRFQEN